MKSIQNTYKILDLRKNLFKVFSQMQSQYSGQLLKIIKHELPVLYRLLYTQHSYSNIFLEI